MAVAVGWNADAFNTLAESYAAIGDMSQALTLYAYVAAGERNLQVRRKLGTSLQRRFGPLFPDESGWSSRVAEAEDEIARRRIADAGAPVKPAGNPTVQTRTGETRSLESLVAGRISIVVFWTGSPLTEAAGLRDNQSELQALEARDVAVITITETPQSPDLDLLLKDEGLDLSVYYDREFQAARSLEVLGVPYHFVVDRQGRFHYAEDMEHAIRLAESFQQMAQTA
jgi:hypothetical protein